MMDFIRKIWTWVRIDGLLHIETIYMISMLVFTAFRLVGSHDFAIFAGFATGMVAGVAKEIWDLSHEGHSAEDHDLYCDFIGSGLALICMLVLHG